MSVQNSDESPGEYLREDWYSNFASKLIEDNFLLTALEFHAELIEAGREVPKLKDFFSNPGNFEQQSLRRPDVTLARSSSQATLDSLDLARYSEDGERAFDEKVAILEFELRKAKETISGLRANLTCAAEADADKTSVPDADRNEEKKNAQASIKPHEQRALNFLINEYLLVQGYKLTSITFADENESQDFEDWDDVGLNVPRPRELLLLYREGLKGTKATDVRCCDAECQAEIFDPRELNLRTAEMEAEMEQLKSLVSELEHEKEKLLETLAAKHEEETKPISQESASPEPDLFEMIDEMKSRGSSETKSIQSNGDWTKINEITKNSFDLRLDNLSPEDKEDIGDHEAITFSRKVESTDEQMEEALETIEDVEITRTDIVIARVIPERFKKEIFKCCDISLAEDEDVLSQLVPGGQLSDLNVEIFVEILTLYLQKIIPNIILNKREEIIPLLVLTICLCSDAAERDKLLTLLFNLKKRPQDEERRQILNALVTIARTRGPAITESELLPQCWEQIGHKYMERRLLVAEGCFLLAPYVSETIRNSLVLSMIQQLAQDREETIRCCSVRCLTVLVTLITIPDKLSQLCDISLELLTDSSAAVSQQVHKVLLPALAQWSGGLRRLQSDLLEKLLSQISRSPADVLFSALEALLPYLVMFIADSETVLSRLGESHPLAAKRQEFAALCKGLYDPLVFYSGSVGSVVSAFDHITANLEESTDWPELDWVMCQMLPRLLKVAEDNWDQKQILHSLVSLLRNLCAGLGKNITYNLIKPELSRRLETCSSGLISGQVQNLEMIPLYLVGVLSLGPRDGAGLEQVGGTLLEFLCGLPLCCAPLLPLQVSVECLVRMDALRLVVLDTLWEGVVHQRPLVRCATASLFRSAVPHTPDDLLAARVAPALVTLANDPEVSVKLAVIPTLGLLADAKEKQTRDKVTMTFQALLTESTGSASTPLALQLAATLTEHFPRFDLSYKNDVIMPQLALMAALCEANKSSDLVKALTETFTVIFSTSQLSSQVLASHVIPALKSLETSCRQLELLHLEQVESLLRHAERLAPSTPGTPPRPLPSEPTALSPGARVEDVKNRVTKMFNTRPQTLQTVSGMFKKKL